ncbi:MAG: YfcE family phosphodiesterase [Thermoleophilia bacterium]
MIADTHVGEFLDQLPHAALHALAGSDLILHAGDLSDESVIPALERIAPVVAVHGDHDLPSAPDLPRRAVVQAGGLRIGLVHGRRTAADIAVITAHWAARRRLRFDMGRARSMARAFRGHDVDVVVFGHWHEAVITHAGGVLVFSPGAVCPWGSLQGGRLPRPGPAGVADRVVRRYRQQLGDAAMRSSVGRLVTGPLGVHAEVVPLADA